MKHTYRKNILRTVRETFSRFAAILAIVALGVGFLAGLLSTTPDMRYSADLFYDETRLFDVRVVGTMGLTDADMTALRAVDGVEEVMPAYAADMQVTLAGTETLVARLHSLPVSSAKERDPQNYLNRIELTEGRLPAAPYECVLETSSEMFDAGVEVGDKLTVSELNKNPEDTLAVQEFTVVGKAKSSYYFSMEREPATVGNGSMELVMYVPAEAFSLEVYTDAYLTLTGMREMDSITQEYLDAVDVQIEKIEGISGARCEARLAGVKADAQKELDDARQEYEDGLREYEDGLQEYNEKKAEAEQELADARKKLADGRAEYIDGQQTLVDAAKQIADGQTELDKQKTDVNAQLNDAAAALASAESQLAAGRQELAAGEAKYNDGKQQYDTGAQQLADAAALVVQIELAVQKYSAAKDGYDAAQTGLDGALTAIRDEDSSTLTAFDTAQGAVTVIVNGLTAQNPFMSDEVAARAILTQLAATDATYAPALQVLEEACAARDVALGGLLMDPTIDAAQRGSLQTAADGVSQAAAAYGQLVVPFMLANDGDPAAGKPSTLDTLKDTIATQTPVLEASKKQLDEAAAQLEAARAKINEGEAQLASGRALLSTSTAQAAEEFAKAEQTLADARREYADGQIELTDAAQQLADGEREYAEAKADADAQLADAAQELADAEVELADAKIEIDDAQKEIDELKLPEWYVLSRESNVSYVSFFSNVQKVDAIAKIFPLFFFLVAALVALTTMTRMVEEERLQIGTLKALGYARGAIMWKYMFYALAASVLGSVIGLAVGIFLFPSVIWNAYTMMYTLPQLHCRFIPSIAITSALAAIGCTLAATLNACWSTLHETPARLMLPKAPKAGKRIFLEHIGFIWKRMKFTHKVTARNLMRYKKRFFMTVIGIAGCTGLLVTGFGLHDSISDIVNKQFDELFLYNLTISLSEDETAQSAGVTQALAEHGDSEYLTVHQEQSSNRYENMTFNTHIFVPQDSADFAQFICLRDRKTGEPVAFSETGVVITEKMSERTGYGVGDTFLLENNDGDKGEFTIAGVTENYVENYVYMSAETYERAYGEAPDFASVVARVSAEKEHRDELSTALLVLDGVSGVSFTDDLKESFSSMMQKIDTIVVVLILSAAALAFVVLYNLTNINITEREKEIATIKVLGFFDREVSAYVYRESLMLSLIGTTVGLVLGIFLHAFVIQNVEVDAVMFGRDIRPISFVYSAALTMLFSVIVNLVMYGKLRRISMVESMKAPE